MQAISHLSLVIETQFQDSRSSSGSENLQENENE